MSKNSTSSSLDLLSGKLNEKTSLHLFWVHVYLEDTDAGGMVYHANYLKFAERARTEFLNLLGIHHAELMKDPLSPCFFVLKECSISFFKSAYLGDLLEIQTTFLKMTHARLFVAQEIFSKNVLIARLHITLACVKNSGYPTRIPPSLKTMLKSFLKDYT